MNQHLHIITLGVRDLEASRKFYAETLGWKISSASNEGITFFQAGGIVLALFDDCVSRESDHLCQ